MCRHVQVCPDEVGFRACAQVADLLIDEAMLHILCKELGTMIANATIKACGAKSGVRKRLIDLASEVCVSPASQLVSLSRQRKLGVHSPCL